MADAFAMVATAVTATNAVTLIQSSISFTNIIRALSFVNIHTANTSAVTISVTSGSTASELKFAIYTQVTCQQSISVLDQPLVLNPSDTLRITCNPVNEVHAFVSYLRIS